MRKFTAFLTRHRTLLLMCLMLATLAVCSTLNRLRLQGDTTLTSLPVKRTDSADAAPVTAYISQRDAAYQADVAALTALVNQSDLDSRTREEAAQQLQALVADHTGVSALEEALASTSLWPCAAVISSGSLTLITSTQLTESDTALVLTLAQAHTGIAPEQVRILQGE